MAENTDSESFGESPIVDVYVGPEKKLYRYHKVVLCRGSPYFATSLKDAWNGKALQLEIKDVDLETFATVMSWIYKFAKPSDLPLTSKTFVADIARLYKFADYLMMEEARNALVDRLIIYLSGGHRVNFSELISIYELELSDTKFFQLALRNCVRSFIKFPSEYQSERVGHSCGDIQDTTLLTIVLEGVRGYHLEPWDDVKITDRCQHHDHASPTICIKLNPKPAFPQTGFDPFAETPPVPSPSPTPTPARPVPSSFGGRGQRHPATSSWASASAGSTYSPFGARGRTHPATPTSTSTSAGPTHSTFSFGQSSRGWPHT